MSINAPPLPPLPSLEIHAMSKLCGLDQQTVDHVMQAIYENRPDLFAGFMDRERKAESGEAQENTQDDFPNIFSSYLIREFNLLDLTSVSNMVFEARRRARLMIGVDI